MFISLDIISYYIINVYNNIEFDKWFVIFACFEFTKKNFFHIGIFDILHWSEHILKPCPRDQISSHKASYILMLYYRSWWHEDL